MRYLLAALAIAMTPVCAMAQPATKPTRDVVVTYHVTGNTMGGPGQGPVDTIRIGFTAGAQRTWIEPVGQPYRMIADRTTGQMTMIMMDKHLYMQMPYDQKRIMNFEGDDDTFTRKGTATVAGLACTVYDVQGPQHSGTACLTDDGVLLKGDSQSQQRHGTIEATAVDYGTQPEEAFQPPAGFQKMDMSQMGRRPSGG
jgi:hypothetical protein